MRELTATLSASADLTARAGVVALQVAEVLEAHCAGDEAAAAAVAFLRRWADGCPAVPGDRQQPLDRLAARHRLSPAEVDLVLLAGLAEEHEGIAATFRTMHPYGEPRPTIGLAALILGGSPTARSELRAVVTGGRAVRKRLLQLRGAGPFFERSLVLAEALWESLHGFDAWPTDLPRVDLPAPPPGLAGWLREPAVQRAAAALHHERPLVVLISCPDESIALARCAALAAAAGASLVCGRVAATDQAAITSLDTHAAVRGALPALMIRAADLGASPLALDDLTSSVVVCAPPGTVLAAPDRAVLVLTVRPVDVVDQQAAWSAAAPALSQSAATIAARHPLDPAVTAQIAIDLRASDHELDVADISALVRARAAVTLPVGVDLVTSRIPWEHLVLPADSERQLRDAVARLDHQGVVLDDWNLRETAHAARGVRLLFTGPPGTGKSLAAHALAAAAHTDLLVVDVSRLVSKWLGETEKNLAAAFDTAERTQAVLLLDEADALFGTRTEISDAHDRYANLETAYLLQRLDHFDGLTILTTNLRANIDPAFARRMDFVVDFPLPDQDGRADLWRRHLPAAELSRDVDVRALARLYPVPGAWIRNASVAAAFGAAADHKPISQQHLVAAMRREYAKASQTFPGEPPRRRHDQV